MKDTQNLIITLLAVTAVILGAMLLSSYRADNTAYADTPVKQGDYILGTGAIEGSTDLIYIVDIATQQLNVYRTNLNTGAINLIDRVNLERAFAR